MLDREYEMELLFLDLPNSDGRYSGDLVYNDNPLADRVSSPIGRKIGVTVFDYDNEDKIIGVALRGKFFRTTD